VKYSGTEFDTRSSVMLTGVLLSQGGGVL